VKRLKNFSLRNKKRFFTIPTLLKVRTLLKQNATNMFTIDQIQAAHSKVKSGADFPAYVQDLKSLGVTHYELMVEDGRTVYFGENNYTTSGKSKYPKKVISEISSPEKLKKALIIHQQGQTDFLTFCQQAADAGVEKWSTDLMNMEVIYFSKQGEKLVVEAIPLR